MLLGHVLDVAQPVVDQPVAVVSEGRGDTAAAVVAAHDDVADVEDVDGVLEDREAVEVGVHDDVGDVAVDEDLPGQQADDLVGGHAAVRAADPEKLRRLLVCELLEEVGLVVHHARRPVPVLPEEALEGGHGSSVVDRVRSPAAASSRCVSRPIGSARTCPGGVSRPWSRPLPGRHLDRSAICPGAGLGSGRPSR